MAKKILIIEDNESMGALLLTQLQKAGFEVLHTPDAMLGTKECIRWRPDLVLLDLMLPAGGGLGVLRSMQKSVYTKNTPVIVLSGSNDPALHKQVQEFGIQAFITKPHDPDYLIARINSTLGISTPPASAQ
jgi:DNA-binding response OmpR family regulator